jgi:GTP-binding protein
VKITAEFVRSATGESDVFTGRVPAVALVGRSNVGKSSLINALVRRRIARTSASPGKTRLVNIFQVERGTSPPFYLVDLPGYGYARGGDDAARAFGEMTRALFGREGQEGPPGSPALAAVLLVDARHPGLESDVQAWEWLKGAVASAAIIATKIDKLARGQRIRALAELESVFHDPVVPVSAVTGEGLDELWKLIDSLASNRNNINPRSRNRSFPPKGTARRPQKK